MHTSMTASNFAQHILMKPITRVEALGSSIVEFSGAASASVLLFSTSFSPVTSIRYPLNIEDGGYDRHNLDTH